MALVLAAPLALVGLFTALSGRSTGVPLLLAADLVGLLSRRFGVAVFAEVLALALAGWGLGILLGPPRPVRGGRWLPVVGLVVGAAGGGGLAGGLGLFYGMIGGATLGGLLARQAGGGRLPPAALLLEALRHMSVAVAGLWLIGHLL